ncbi:hypothetical protein Ddye_001597 [Dipteronia dyeriana]|uniref:Uncharacterized protein n=1 Tax=Dipteronia dyeriana TaxID=168575 RepID=A0AAD9XQ65_9ROSI|nr:hypothetical protein Ddye_001597 [Dipteronia dyeriana]
MSSFSDLLFKLIVHSLISFSNLLMSSSKVCHLIITFRLSSFTSLVVLFFFFSSSDLLQRDKASKVQFVQSVDLAFFKASKMEIDHNVGSMEGNESSDSGSEDLRAKFKPE